MNFHRITNRGLQSRQPIKTFLTACIFYTIAALMTACASNEPKQPELEKQPDRWVNSVTLDSDSKVRYVGKTENYAITSITSVEELDGLQTINIGDEIEGIRIGAIKCSFFWKDSFQGREQFMWRGRWGCQAGRSEQEIENSIGEEGEKYFDYIHTSPVSLESE